MATKHHIWFRGNQSSSLAPYVSLSTVTQLKYHTPVRSPQKLVYLALHYDVCLGNNIDDIDTVHLMPDAFFKNISSITSWILKVISIISTLSELINHFQNSEKTMATMLTSGLPIRVRKLVKFISLKKEQIPNPPYSLIILPTIFFSIGHHLAYMVPKGFGLKGGDCIDCIPCDGNSDGLYSNQA